MNLLSRGRARSRVCLLVLTVCLAGAAFTAPSASATNFAVLFGGTQGGSDQDATYVWSSSSTPQAQNLSFIYGAGYWPHMHKIQRECTLQQATTTACPTASRIATVAATFSKPGSILPVVRTGYIALERKRSGELMGYDVLVVLDQNSSYARYVGRRRVEVLKSNKNGDPSANSRIDLGAPPELVTRAGAASNARMTGLAITTQKRWMRLPTNCDGSSSVSAVTTFEDGSVESVPRIPAVTGCGSLTVDAPLSAMFNPREYTLDKPVPWKASARIGDHANDERVTDPRTIRMKMMGAPKIGEATAVFTVICTQAQAEAAACPAQSRLGEFCVESSPAGEVACGDAWNAGVRQPGSAGGGAGGSVGLLLSLTKFSSGAGGGGGGGAGGLLWVGNGSVQIVPGTGESILTINDLPQADLHAFRMSGDNPLFEANRRCGNNPLRATVTGWNGLMREQTMIQAVACTPGIETTDARDADSDGDGIADKKWLPANFKINFRVSDRGEGVDPSSISCSFKGWDGTIKGSPRVDDDDGDGLADSCSISSATGGDGVLEIRAADWRGHVTVLKLGYSVDVWLPAVQTIDPIDDDADGDGTADDEFREPSFSVAFEATDEGSGIDDDASTCGAEDLNGIGLPKVTPKIAKESHGKFRCIVEGADDGPIVIVATVRDVTGHVTVLKRQWTVDSQGPVMNTTEPEDEDCDARADEIELSCFRPAFFDVFFSATDAGSGVDWITNTCAIRLLGGAVPGGAVLQSARVVDLDHDGTPDACRVENAPEGDVEVDISVADHRGHVTVLKSHYTVDTTPPAIAIDEPGAHFAPGAFFDIFTDLGFTIDGLRGHRDVGGYRCAFHLEGDFDSISRPTSNCAPAGELGGPPALPLQPGLNHAQFKVMDPAGNISISFFDIFYDNVHPEITLVDGRDQDCDDETEDVAPTCYRQAFFDVFFSATDAGEGVDWTTAACRGVVKKKPDGTSTDGRIIDADHNGIPEGCGFDGLEEDEYDVEISVADYRGHVTVLKLHYGVDATPPASEFTDPMDADTNNDSIPDFLYRVSSFDAPLSLTDEGGSGVDPSTSSCEVRLIGGALPGGAVISAAVSMVDTNSDGDVDACRVSDAPAGRLRVEVVVRDRAGNRSDSAPSAIREWIVDTTPPDTTLDNSSTRTTPSTSFGTRMRVTDDNGVAGVRCGVAIGAGAAAGAATLCANGSCTAVPGGGTSTPGSGEYECVAVSEAEGLVRYEVVATDLAGNRATSFFDVFFDRTPPAVEPVDPLDLDDDADGYATNRYRESSFEFAYDIADASSDLPGLGLDAGTCVARPAVPGSGETSYEVLANGAGKQQSCSFTGLADGDWEVGLDVDDHAGNSGSHRVLVTVDTTPPAVSFFDPGSEPFIPDPWLHFDVVDVNPGRSVCSLVNLDTGEAVGEDDDCDGFTDSAGESCDPADPAVGDCKRTYPLPHVFDQKGRYQATVTHTDKAGNSGTDTMIFRVENDPPTLSLTDPLDDDCDATSDNTARCYRQMPIDLPFHAVDEGSGVAAVSCTATLADGTSRDLAVHHHGSSQSSGHRVSGACTAGDLPEGDIAIELKAVDFRGHVTVLKLSVTVDSTDPVVQFFNPGSEPFTWNPPLNPPTLRFDLDEANPGLSRCEIVSLDGVVLSTETCGDGYVNQAGETCDPGDPAAGDCKRTYAFPHVFDQRGRFMARVVHTDRAANASFASVQLEVADPDLDPPEIAIDESGVHFALEGFFDVFTDLGFTIDGLRGHRDVGGYRCDFHLEGDFDSISRPTSNCAPADDGGPPAASLRPGLNHAQLRVMDAAGNISEAFFDIFYDVGPPRISPIPDGAPDQVVPTKSFGIGFEAVHGTFSLDTDEPATICWMLDAHDASLRFDGRVVVFGGLDDTIEFRCEFENVPDGAYELHVVVTDVAGLDGVYSRPLTVDTTPPAVSFFDPGSEPFNGWPMLTFAVDDVNLGSSVCSLVNVDTGETVGEDEDCDGYADGAGRPCEPDDPIGYGDCKRTFPEPHVLESSGRYRATVVHTDLAGHVGSGSVEFTVDTDGPEITLTDGRDDDCDDIRDDVAPSCYRPAFFDVFFSATDSGAGVDWSTAACRGIVWKRPDSAPIDGRLIDADDNGIPEGCGFDGLEENEYDVEISVADYRGHVTVLKLHYSVDSTPPAIAIDEQGVHYSSSTSQDLSIEIDEPNLRRVKCGLAQTGGVIAQGAGRCENDTCVATGDDDGDGVPDFRCHVDGLADGRNEFEVTATDAAGNATTVRYHWQVDTTKPHVTTTSPADADSDGDGTPDQPLRGESFEVAYESTDAGSGIDPASPACAVESGPAIALPKVTPKISTESHGKFSCVIEGASSGPLTVVATVSDLLGHVTVLKLHFTIDADPPVIVASSGETQLAHSSSHEIKFEVDEQNLRLVRCGLATGAGAAAGAARCVGEGDDDDCDLIDDLDGDSLMDVVCSVTDLAEGVNRFDVVATDAVGHHTNAHFDVIFDTIAPVISTIDPIDDDSDDDGMADDSLRSESFDVLIEMTDAGSGIDPDGLSCDVTSHKRDFPRITPKVALESTGKARLSIVVPESGVYDVECSISDRAGHLTVLKRGFTVDADAPVVATTRPVDADLDDDGFADRRFRPAFFDIFFEASDGGFGVDWVQNTCAVRMLRGDLPGGAVMSARLVDPDGDGRPDVCRIENAPEGDAEVSISVVDGGGHVTVLKLSVTVDNTAPSIAIDEQGVHFTANNFFDIWTDLFVMIDGKSEAADLTEFSCSIIHEADLDGDGELEMLSRTTTACGGGGSGGSLRVLPTVNKITLEVGDAAGNMSSRIVDVYLDLDAPSIAIDEPGVQITGDPDFDLMFTADDDSLDAGGPLSASCTRKGWDGTIKGSAKLTKADAGRALAGECSFTGVADGTYEVELSVIDGGGHVTVLKHSMTVDTTPPAISGLSPADGEWIACPATDDPTATGVVPISFTLSDSSADLESVEVEFSRGPRQTVSLDGTYQHVKFDMKVDCRELTTGMDVEYRVYATDRAGNKDDQPATVLIDKAPPVLKTVDPRDDDSDGDGFADDRYRPMSVELFFDTYEEGSGIAENGISCGLEDPAGRAAKGTVKVIKDTTGGMACMVEDAEEGDLFVVVTVADVSGHVTVLKRGVTVDGTAPVIRTVDPWDEDSDDDGTADAPVRDDDFGIWFDTYDERSGIDAASFGCELQDETGALAKGRVVVIKDGEGGFACQFSEVEPGEVKVVATVRDQAGNVVLLGRLFAVDEAAPSLVLTDSRDADSDGDGVADDPFRESSFSVPFGVENDPDGRAVQSARCTVRGWDPAAKQPIIGVADTDGNGAADVCRIEGAPSGKIKIEIGAAGQRGVDVVIREFVVQAPESPPAA